MKKLQKRFKKKKRFTDKKLEKLENRLDLVKFSSFLNNEMILI
jgi:hypothetical protein